MRDEPMIQLREHVDDGEYAWVVIPLAICSTFLVAVVVLGVLKVLGVL